MLRFSIDFILSREIHFSSFAFISMNPHVTTYSSRNTKCIFLQFSRNIVCVYPHQLIGIPRQARTSTAVVARQNSGVPAPDAGYSTLINGSRSFATVPSCKSSPSYVDSISAFTRSSPLDPHLTCHFVHGE